MMNKIDELELMNINGGGISFWTVIGISALVVFIAGVLDGFTRPLKCN